VPGLQDVGETDIREQKSETRGPGHRPEPEASDCQQRAASECIRISPRNGFQNLTA
jgi:hypothetical protein